MTTILPPNVPPPPMPTAGSAGAAALALVATAVEAGELPDLPAGGQAEAVLQARPLRGVVEVLIAGKPLTLRLPPDLAALPPGTRLTVQLFMQDGQPAFRILAVGGRTAGQAAPQTPVQGQPAPPHGMAPALASGLSPPPAPQGVTATVLKPAADPAAPAPPQATGNSPLPPDLAPGTTVTVRIAATQPPPPAQPQPQTQAAIPGQAAPAAQQPATQQQQQQPAAAAPQSAPLQTAPRPQPAQTPQALPALPAPQPAPGQPPTLPGTVVAHPPGGQAVVRTPAGTLALPVPDDLPVGSGVDLEIVGKPTPPAPPPSAPADAAKADGLGKAGWPALREVIDTLRAADPQAVERLLHDLPQANSRLAATLSLFAAAVKSNDARQILTEAVARGLERANRRDLGARIKGDVESLSRDSARPLAGGDWQAMTVPFLNQQHIEAIRLYRRYLPEDRDGSGRKDGGGERFVVEVSMSRIGRVQLDGLVRRDDKAFDLIIRTERPLPGDMRADIQSIFTGNAEVCGITGMVGFQAGRFVDLPPVEAAGGTTLTV